MNNYRLLFPLLLACCSAADAATRTSASYSIATESLDATGTHVQSANYSVNGSAVGEFGAGQSALITTADYTGKSGFVGQLYDLISLNITAPPFTNLNETASRQLNAAPLADDTTMLANLDPSTVNWSIVGGPITSISVGGLATAGNVYQDTRATIGGDAQNLSGQLNLTVLNVTNDDYGSYANDGIDDSWQIQYFGENNPNAGPDVDADGTGQTNLFKFIAGLNPLDGSRFTLSIQQVSGQLSQKNLIFNPIVIGRTYLVQFATDLTSPSWSTLSGTNQIDNGNERTVTDLSATTSLKFYRVQIAKP